MSAVTPSASPSTGRVRHLTVGVAASVLHLILLIPGYSEGLSLEELQVGRWLAVLAVSLAVTVIVFALVVPRGGAISALILATVALLSVAAFWGGVTLPLATAASIVGMRERHRRERATVGMIAVGLSSLAAVALVAVVISDAVR